ncbi:MAG: branched-chain amino acid ABC transporter permease [Candidatus Bathyarchaeia archaeon]
MIHVELLLTTIVQGILVGGIYALLAMGTNLIVGIMNIINLSQGDFAMLGMFTAFWLFALFGITPLISLPLAFLLTFIAGFLLTKFIFVRVFGLQPIYSVLLTYGLALFVMNAAQAVWTGDYRRIDVSYGALRYSFLSVNNNYLIAFIFATVLSFVIYSFLTRTRLGKAIRAVSQDPDAAASSGINVRVIRAITAGIGLGLAGAAGVLMTLIYFIYPYVGSTFTIKAIIVCVLGGLGNVMGAYFSALIIGLAESLSLFFVPYGLKDAVGFIIFILILLFRPKGLFGG